MLRSTFFLKWSRWLLHGRSTAKEVTRTRKTYREKDGVEDETKIVKAKSKKIVLKTPKVATHFRLDTKPSRGPCHMNCHLYTILDSDINRPYCRRLTHLPSGLLGLSWTWPFEDEVLDRVWGSFLILTVGDRLSGSTARALGRVWGPSVRFSFEGRSSDVGDTERCRVRDPFVGRRHRDRFSGFGATRFCRVW